MDPGPPRPRRTNLVLIGAVALALVHFVWVTAHLAPAIMSPDANGYVVQARLIAEAGRTSFSTASPVQYVGMHWLETDGGVFHSRYPAGLPVIFAAAWKLGGLKAALFVNPLLASATVLLVFFLARRLMRDSHALLAAAFVAVVPVTNQHALDADAHVASACFLVGGVLALLHFGDTRSSRSGFLAGVLLGAVPTIRYPEAIVGLAVGAWLLWRVRPVQRVWPAVVGAALPLGALFLHNAGAYGAFWRTGYALTNEQTGFGVGYFSSHALPYLQALGGQGIALVFAFGVAGLAALATDPRRRSEGVLFAGIVVPLVLLYMAYYFGGGGGGAGGGAAVGNLRFLVPTFPFFTVAGVWLLARLADHLGNAGRAATVAVAALQLLLGIVGSVQMLSGAKASLGAAARARIVAEKDIPAGSVVIVERQLAESFDAAGRWKLVEENLVAGMGIGPGGGMGPGGPGGLGGPGGGRGGFFPGAGGPDGGDPGAAFEDNPSPMQRGKNRAQQERYAGLRPDQRRKQVWADIAAWAGDKPVFWFARSLDAVDNALPLGADFRTVAEVDAPSMIGPGGGPPGGAPMGMMPGMPGRGSMPGRGFMPGGGNARGGPGFAGGPGMAGGRRGGGAATTPARLRILRLDLPKP